MSHSGLFAVCLTISLVVHSVLFLGFPYRVIRPFIPPKPIEVSYEQGDGFRPQAASPQEALRPFLKTPLPKIDTAQMQKPLMEQAESPAELIKTELFKKPAFKETDALKKVINLPSVPGEVARSPEYKSYYQVIRERIRRLAYQNYKKLHEGEVFLTFTVTAQGQIVDIAVNDAKSVKNDYLRDIAVRSVQDASPYPEFPEKLKNNKRLSFNVIISFELK